MSKPFIYRFAISCLWLLMLAAPASARVKGLWVVRYSLTSPANVKKIVAEAHKAGVNHLFVQYYARGEAYYPSRLVPTADYVSRDFDPLAQMLKECKARGIKMHAWINVYFVWSSERKPRDPRHAYYQDDSWFAADARGRSLKDFSPEEIRRGNLEGVYLSPASAGVKEYIRELVREILFNYDVDGIHLDYVRYGNLNYSYDVSSRNGFYGQYQVDPLALLDGGRQMEPYWQTWQQWRMYQISDLVAQLKSDIAKFNPWVKLSAAVKPDPDEARLSFGQDWPSWLEHRWVDFVVLMNYSAKTETVLKLARKATTYKGQGQIYVGLGAWRDSMEGLMEKIRALRKEGMDDIVLFSYDGLVQRKISFEMLKHRGF